MVDQKTDYDRRVVELQDALVGKLYSSLFVFCFVFQENLYQFDLKSFSTFLVNLGKNNFLVNSKGSQVLVSETNFLGLTAFLFFYLSLTTRFFAGKCQFPETAGRADQPISGGADLSTASTQNGEFITTSDKGSVQNH